MINSIKEAVVKLKNIPGEIHVIAHHDTDGITSAAILTKALQREEKQFTLSICKRLTSKMIEEILQKKYNIIFLLDFGSEFLEKFEKTDSEVFIIDHHEINTLQIPQNVQIINPFIFNEENIRASVLTYLFSKELNSLNKDLSSLAIIGMINESRRIKNCKIGKEILKDSKDIKIKKSILLFPATRPIDKALEFSNIFIPGITGSSGGARTLLNKAKIKTLKGSYKTLLELNKEETKRLLNLLNLDENDPSSVGDIYLIKFFNHFEDARELSALINACGRMNKGFIALEMCLGNKKSRSIAESIYGEYKHKIISSLKTAVSTEKIEEENYIIINNGNRIEENLLSTVISVISSSFMYPSGKIIIGMTESDNENIKISSRISHGDNSILEGELGKIIEPLLKKVGGEGGGSFKIAGGIIPKEKAPDFIKLIQEKLNPIIKN